MSTYRDPARPTREVLDSYDVATAAGSNLLGILIAMVGICVVAFVVSLIRGTPRELDGWVWTFPVGAALFAVPSVLVWKRRRRILLVVRDGGVLRMVVEGELDATFPLVASGAQLAEQFRGASTWHVYLKLVGSNGQAVVFHEVRGTIHGAEQHWPDDLDRVTKSVAYDLSGAGTAAKLRRRVSDLNRELSGAA